MQRIIEWLLQARIIRHGLFKLADEARQVLREQARPLLARAQGCHHTTAKLRLDPQELLQRLLALGVRASIQVGGKESPLGNARADLVAAGPPWLAGRARGRSASGAPTTCRASPRRGPARPAARAQRPAIASIVTHRISVLRAPREGSVIACAGCRAICRGTTDECCRSGRSRTLVLPALVFQLGGNGASRPIRDQPRRPRRMLPMGISVCEDSACRPVQGELSTGVTGAPQEPSRWVDKTWYTCAIVYSWPAEEPEPAGCALG
jgi:hypothetical protein